MNNVAKGIPHMSLDVEGVSSATPIRQKQGYSCCGGCCDVRRAVIIVCIFSILQNIIGLMASTATEHFVNGTASSLTFDDDSLNQTRDQVAEDANSSLKRAMVLQCIGIVAASVGMLGAFMFNKYLVAVNATCLAVTIFVLPSLPVLLVHGLYLYPHVFLIMYIHNEIMSEENYPYEKQSCCCVPPV